MTEAPFVFAPEFRGRNGEQGLPGPGAAAWLALDAVTTGAVRQAPDGSWIKSTTNRTTRATFDTTEAGFWTAVLGTSGTVEDKALKATYLGYWPRGLDLTGAVDATASLSAALNAGERVHLKRGDYYLDRELTAITTQGGGDCIITAEPGTRLLKGHGGRGIYSSPPEIVIGAVNPAAPGAESVTTADSHTYTADQWVGYRAVLTYAKIADLALWDSATLYDEDAQVKWPAPGPGVVQKPYQSVGPNNINNAPSPSSRFWIDLSAQRRTVVGNSGGTGPTTFEFDRPLGTNVGTGTSLSMYKEFNRTVMDGFKVLDVTNGGAGGGLANIVLNFPGICEIDVESEGSAGNPMSIYMARGGQIRARNKGGSILVFIYHSDDLDVDAWIGPWGNFVTYHGLQFKDCRNCHGNVTAAAGLARAGDIKASGLNYTNGNTMGGTAVGTTAIAWDLYALQNEGTIFLPKNYRLTKAVADACQTAFRIYCDPALALGPRNLMADHLQATDTLGTALEVMAKRAMVDKVQIDGSGAYPILLNGANGATVERIQVTGANRTSNTEIVRTVNTTGARVGRVKVDLLAGDPTRQLVNELAGGSNANNRYPDWEVTDPAAVLTSDYTLQAGSTAIRHPDLDPGAPVSAGVDSTPREFRLPADDTAATVATGTPSLTTNGHNLTGFVDRLGKTATLARNSRYTGTLILRAEGSDTCDIMLGFDSIGGGATIAFWFETAPQTSATGTTGNNSSRHAYQTGFLNSIPAGLLQAGTVTPIRIGFEVITGTATGILTPRHCQLTAGASPSIVHLGSKLTLKKEA